MRVMGQAGGGLLTDQKVFHPPTILLLAAWSESDKKDPRNSLALLMAGKGGWLGREGGAREL